MKTVAVFGVFDGLHTGHLYFLRKAKEFGNKLVVIIARDSTVKTLKGKKSRMNEKERLGLIRALKIVDQAVLGDKKLSSYGIVKKIKPAIICLGYDQRGLRKDIKRNLPKTKLSVLKAYKGQRFHASKIFNIL